MNTESTSLRIGKNYLYGFVYLILFAAAVYMLLRTIQAMGSVSYVFFLAVSSLSFFFLCLLSFALPYFRVDEDRIIVYHDLLRKDTLFFYDITRIEFENETAISIYHLNGLTKVLLSKMNGFDKKKVKSFFAELNSEKTAMV